MATKPSILLIGAGGHARACIDVIETEGRFTIEGLLGLPQEVGRQVLGYPVLGTDDDLPEIAQNIGNALVTLGQIESPQPRIDLFRQLMTAGCGLPTVISSRAYVSHHAKLSVGTIIMHGAIVNAGAIIGQNCIINSHALIEHDACVGDHCHISTAAIINGGVCMGEGCFVGSGTVVREGIRIDAKSFIGMGKHIRADCNNHILGPSRKDKP